MQHAIVIHSFIHLHYLGQHDGQDVEIKLVVSIHQGTPRNLCVERHVARKIIAHLCTLAVEDGRPRGWIGSKLINDEGANIAKCGVKGIALSAREHGGQAGVVGLKKHGRVRGALGKLPRFGRDELGSQGAKFDGL